VSMLTKHIITLHAGFQRVPVKIHRPRRGRSYMEPRTSHYSRLPPHALQWSWWHYCRFRMGFWKREFLVLLRFFSIFHNSSNDMYLVALRMGWAIWWWTIQNEPFSQRSRWLGQGSRSCSIGAVELISVSRGHRCLQLICATATTSSTCSSSSGLQE
jgi:hypothetical protein